MEQDFWPNYAGKLRGTLNSVPMLVIYDKELNDVPMEYRMKISKFLEQDINKEIARIRSEYGLPLDK